jgi:hypothetical protein
LGEGHRICSFLVFFSSLTEKSLSRQSEER